MLSFVLLLAVACPPQDEICKAAQKTTGRNTPSRSAGCIREEALCLGFVAGAPRAPSTVQELIIICSFLPCRLVLDPVVR